MRILSGVRMVRVVAVIGLLLVASPTLGAPLLFVAETPAGTAIDWTGGTGPWDVIRTNLSALTEGATTVDLGDATIIECGSPDMTTRFGFEDLASPLPGEVFLYMVRGDSYGTPSFNFKERIPASGTD